MTFLADYASVEARREQPTLGEFSIDPKSEPGVLRLRLTGTFKPEQMSAFVEAHDRAVDAYRGEDYRVFVDIQELSPLDAACADLFERAKRHSAAQPNFRGSAVLVSSATVAMQHRRTSQTVGLLDTELISDDLDALRRHLATVSRRAG